MVLVLLCLSPGHRDFETLPTPLKGSSVLVVCGFAYDFGKLLIVLTAGD